MFAYGNEITVRFLYNKTKNLYIDFMFPWG